MIDYKNLTLPDEERLPTEDPVPIGSGNPVCSWCQKELTFTPKAMETIAIRRMCEVSQTVFSCPYCDLKMSIEPQGDVPVTSSEKEVVVGAPMNGFIIARLRGQ